MRHPNSLANLRRGNPGNRGRPTNRQRMIRALFRLYDIVDPRTGMVNVEKLREFGTLHAAVVVGEIEGQLKAQRKALTKPEGSE